MAKRINLVVLVLTIFFSFILSSVALAGNATRLLVEISYPCHDNQINCYTGEAVSREVDGDKVNVFITILDDSGGPAQAGPYGESLETLTASCSSNLGSINSNRFAADAGIISFNGDASARAYVDYTGSAPGLDQIICVVPALPDDPIVGYANVNVHTSSSVVIDEPTEEATAIVIQQEGPQESDGSQITPCGEALIRIKANGTLSSSKNIEIIFPFGVAEGLELRTLDSDQPLPIPFSVTLNSGEVKRYVVYSPTIAYVYVEAIDLGSEQLDPASLYLPFLCPGPYHCPGVLDVICDEIFLCPSDNCLSCTATTINCNGDVIEGDYSWYLNGEVFTTPSAGNTINVCPEDLMDRSNSLTVFESFEFEEDSVVIDFNGPDCCGTIEVLQNKMLRSRWFPSVATITIRGTGTDWIIGGYDIAYTAERSRDLFILPGTLPWLNPVNQTINQLIIILPAWWSGCCFDGAPEIMTVEVCDTAILPECCVTDTVEIDMLPFPLMK